MNDFSIDQNYKDLIRKHQSKLPVDVIALANDLRINVYKSPGDDHLSGKIVLDYERGGKGGYAIYVNAKHSLNRQRFTIAHEISHYILHKANIGDGIVDDALYRSGLSNKQESMANKLAAEILMPWNLLNEAMNNKFETISALAELFKVSESAMSIRLGVPN